MNFSQELPIVGSADVTPEWMTAMLRGRGIEAEVSGIEAKRVGTGQVGESVRFTLSYKNSAPEGAPASLVGKFPSSDPTSRETAINFGNYIREVRFYRELARSAGIATPQVFFAAVDEQSHDFTLMMEDLALAQPGDQLRGVSVKEAGLVLDEAAKLHASHWGDDVWDEASWLFEVRGGPQYVTQDLVRQLWLAFLDRYSDRVTPEMAHIGQVISTRYDQFSKGYVGPRCLIHNDFRPDNMMFVEDIRQSSVTVVDWQSIGYGCCMADVSYFLGGALSAEDRRQHEETLLKRYHKGLTSRGVENYSFERLLGDYARYGFSLFIMGFTAPMVVERTERGDAMFFAMLNAAAAHIVDHSSVAVLEGEQWAG